MSDYIATSGNGHSATGFNEAWSAGGSAFEPLPLRHEGLSRMQELWLMHLLYSWEMLYWHHIQLDQAGLFALARRHAPLSDHETLIDWGMWWHSLLVCFDNLCKSTSWGRDSPWHCPQELYRSFGFVHPWTKTCPKFCDAPSWCLLLQLQL